MVNGLHAAVETGTEDFRALEPEWDALLARSASRSVFLTWGWLHAWWRHLGGDRELRLVTVRDATVGLVGVAPFCIQREGTLPRLRVLTFLGIERVSSEYLDVIVEPDREQAVVAAIWNALRAGPADWDFARFPDMLEDAAWLRAAEGPALAREYAVEDRPAQICPYMPLPKDRPAFEAAIGGSLRRKARQMERYLERAGVEIRTVDAPAEIPAALDILYDLHARRWSSRRQSGNFRDPRVRAFHAQMAASLAPAHRARVCMLSHPTGPVAALYALEYKDTFFFYQSGFDPDAGRLGLKPHEYSPGFVLVHHCMLDAVRRGVALFDFLRGPEEYKFRWTKESRVTRCLTVVPRANVAALGKHHIGRGLALSRRAVKRILGWKTQAGGGRP